MLAHCDFHHGNFFIFLLLLFRTLALGWSPEPLEEPQVQIVGSVLAFGWRSVTCKQSDARVFSAQGNSTSEA